MAEQNRLEPFLILARGMKGAGAAKVVADATAAPGVYTFGELLDLPNIKELEKDATHAKTYALLQLFAYGTLKDYAAAPESFPPLNANQQAKLKHLTLLSLALNNRSLPYDQLHAALNTPGIAELEMLIIDTIYAGLLTGKIHHHEQVLHVDTVTGRDLRQQELVSVKAGLEIWCQNAQTLLAALDKQIHEVRASAAARAEDDALFAKTLDEAYLEARSDVLKKSTKEKSAASGPVLGGSMQFTDDYQGNITPRSNAIDVDDTDEPMDDDFVPGSSGLQRSLDQRSVESLDERAKKRTRD